MSTQALAPVNSTVEEPIFRLDEWKAEGEELARRKKELIAGTWQLQFDIGDWLIRCENYKEGENITGYTASSLRTFVYVARHVPFYVRDASIPWGVHQLVAPLKSDDDKELFLRNVKKEGWSVAAARVHLMEAQAEGRFESSVVPKSGNDYKSQNHGDWWRALQRSQGKKETTQDETDGYISVERLQRTVQGMKGWKLYPVDDADLSRAVPLLASDDKARVIKYLRKAAQELLTLAEKMEAIQKAGEVA
jgi:hypothetical protein